MSDQTSVRVVCATCKVDPEFVTDADGKAEAVCPGCGQRDDVEDAMRIAQEFALDAVARGLQGGLGDAVRGKDGIEFKPEKIPERTFRWHVA